MFQSARPAGLIRLDKTIAITLVIMPDMGFSGGSAHKEPACNVGDLGSIPGLGRSPGEGRLFTPVFWPGEFHGLYSPYVRKEADTIE